MKNCINLIASVLLVCSAILIGCSKDEHEGFLPESETLKSFDIKFPAAVDVKWVQKSGYDVAYFNMDYTRSVYSENDLDRSNSAWYLQGKPELAYSKVEISWKQLINEAPAVADAWNASEYKEDCYVIDDIHVKMYEGKEPVYKLEIEKDDVERDLVWTKSGKLIYDRVDEDDSDDDDMDDDEDAPCPEFIQQFIRRHFPSAILLNFSHEKEEGLRYYNASVLLEGIKYDLIFNMKCEFVARLLEVDETDELVGIIPAEILAAFKKVEADTSNWDDIYLAYDLTGKLSMYILEVEKETDGKEWEKLYFFDTSGKLVQPFFK